MADFIPTASGHPGANPRTLPTPQTARTGHSRNPPAPDPAGGLRAAGEATRSNIAPAPLVAGHQPDNEPAPTGLVIAFPPTAAKVAELIALMDEMPLDQALPTALSTLRLVESTASDPLRETSNQHAVFMAMLALCRLLDAVQYPWDGVVRRARA